MRGLGCGMDRKVRPLCSNHIAKLPVADIHISVTVTLYVPEQRPENRRGTCFGPKNLCCMSLSRPRITREMSQGFIGPLWWFVSGLLSDHG